MAKTIIIIPAYNEEENIDKVIQEIITTCSCLDYDILVIDDGSTDNTINVLRQLKANVDINVISHGYNLGYGAALQTGYKYALKHNYKYVIQMDADGQHNPEHIPLLLNELNLSDVDIIIGSRYMAEKKLKMNIRRLGTKIFNSLIYIFTGHKITDCTSGFRAFNRKAVEFLSTDIFPYDYPDADMIITMINNGLKIKEIPIQVRQPFPKRKPTSMHSGLRPVYYVFKMIFSIIVTIFRKSIYRKDS